MLKRWLLYCMHLKKLSRCLQYIKCTKFMWSNTGLRQQLYGSAGQSTPRGALGPFMQMYVWMHPASLDCISTDGIQKDLHCCSPRLHTVLRFSVFIKMKSIFYKIRIDLSMLPVTLYRLAKFCGIISMKTDARSLLTQNRPEVYVCGWISVCKKKRQIAGISRAFQWLKSWVL